MCDLFARSVNKKKKKLIVKKSCFTIFFSNFNLEFFKKDLQFANCEALFRALSR